METKLEHIKGIGPSLLHHFRNQNIWSTYDLVLHYPRSYEDFTVRSLSQVHHLDKITVQGHIVSPLKENPYGKVHVITFKMKVIEQVIEVVVFNRSYLMKQFSESSAILVKGTYHIYQKKMIASYVSKINDHHPIKPIYKIEGIYDRHVQNIIKTIFETHQVQIYETIPKEFITLHHLPSRYEAYQMLHLPETFDDIRKAERRFKYEEAFFLQLKLVAKQLESSKREPKSYDLNKVKTLISRLPYELTNDQKQATNDIFKDFKSHHSGIRLIQGDVGSGKTIVSLIAAYAIVTAGEQVAFMAPTTLLANQHYQLFKSLLSDLNIALLTQKTKHKESVKREIKNQEFDIIIGTHALISSDVQFRNLGLVIIDEQHKFGVDARQSLIDKGRAKDVLYLTATPIPRTLAMITFGESNVSVIREKPAKRKPIITKLMEQKDEQKAFEEIEKTVARKEHVFVVVPAITSEQITDNITIAKDKLKHIHDPLFVLHGHLSKDDQSDVMEKFRTTPGSILLATTMVEVGIDIPTATLMVILSAERFGLAQLHQLRGRIGRGDLQSTCYLISEKQDLERLDLMTKTTDGFKLAAFDLAARGPGDFIGVEQSGYLKFNFLELTNDYKILLEAQKNVKTLYEKPDFYSNERYQYLRKHVNESLKI